MISYTQRNPTSETLAVKISGELRKRGKTVWLDVDMAKRDEAAMQEGVKNSRCMVAIISGPAGDDTAYFRRQFCLSELRWAKNANVPVVPVVAAEDKGTITEFFADIPEDLQHLRKKDWIHIDRQDVEYFELGVTKILRVGGVEPEPEPEPDFELDAATLASASREERAAVMQGASLDVLKALTNEFVPDE